MEGNGKVFIWFSNVLFKNVVSGNLMFVLWNLWKG